MPKLNLYKDCGSLKNFVEKYIDDNLYDFLRKNWDSNVEVPKHSSAVDVANAAYNSVVGLTWEFTGKLQIAIADYLEDYEVVEWPKSNYKFRLKQTVGAGDRGEEFGREVNKNLQWKLDGMGYGIYLLNESVKLPPVPMMDIEREHDALEFKYNNMTKGDKASNTFWFWFFYLMAAATLAAVLYFVYIHQYPKPLYQWIILICGLISWPFVALTIKMRAKYGGPSAEYKAEKKELEQALKKIKNSEEYRMARRRRFEMHERIARWQEQMRKAESEKEHSGGLG